MAGAYLDVPGHRMAWDRDGSIGFKSSSGGTITTMTTTEMQKLNEENGSQAFGTNSGSVYVGVIFPELRDIVGWLADFRNGGVSAVHTSVDTTNGFDGTWVARAAPSTQFSSQAETRTDWVSVNWPGVKAVRVQNNGAKNAHAIHIYGSPSVGLAPDRLRFWHPTLDQEVTGAYFDFGDVSRGATFEKTFRVKNPSSTLTASSIALATEALYDTTPTNTSMHTFSSDGTTFTSTLAIGDLAPGALSSVLTVRRTTPSNAALGLWTVRFVASAAAYA